MNENPLKTLTKYTEALKKFSYEHSNTIECLFLIAYSIEQVLLVILTFAYQQHISLIIPLFVIIAFFTFGIQKLIIEAKNKYLEKIALELTWDNKRLIDYIKGFKQEKIDLHILKNMPAKGLNKGKTNNIKGGKND